MSGYCEDCGNTMCICPRGAWSDGDGPRANDPGVLFGLAVRDTSTEAANLLMSKHADYGPKNIADAPGGPLNGLAVRLHDKLSRLSHLMSTEGQPNHESLRDTLIDIANYGLIGVLVVDGEWPGVPPIDVPGVRD